MLVREDRHGLVNEPGELEVQGSHSGSLDTQRLNRNESSGSPLGPHFEG